MIKDCVDSAIRDERLVFSLPIPPSVNSQYNPSGRRLILSEEARNYKVCAVYMLKRYQSVVSCWPHYQTRSYALSITFYFKELFRRDIDGGVKILQDVICESLGINDNRVVELHVEKVKTTTRPYTRCYFDLLKKQKSFVCKGG